MDWGRILREAGLCVLISAESISAAVLFAAEPPIAQQQFPRVPDVTDSVALPEFQFHVGRRMERTRFGPRVNALSLLHLRLQSTLAAARPLPRHGNRLVRTIRRQPQRLQRCVPVKAGSPRRTASSRRSFTSTTDSPTSTASRPTSIRACFNCSIRSPAVSGSASTSRFLAWSIAAPVWLT